MDERSDGQLFATIASGDAGAVRTAQQELYQRHVRYLFGALQRQQPKLLKLAGLSADDVVQDTFQRAFDRASTFEVAQGVDDERARRRTRAWLGRIAQNLIADAFRRFREVSASPYLEQLAVPAPDDAPPSSRPDLEPMRQALASLSDREQDILRVSALYYKAEGSERLPNAVSAELSKRWATSNDNIRAIRSRAMKKLRRAMIAHQPVENSR
jgi:RNA polymerase sigma factor (sigma-70 family)